MFNIFLAVPRGFCAGVTRALECVERVLADYPPPVYIYHDIVHNTFVINKLKRRGAVCVDSLDAVPDGGVIVFSAHGVAPEVEREAAAKRLEIVDAGCPLVKKIHTKVRNYLKQNKLIILIGHRDHPEIIGTLGQSEGRALVVESVADIKRLPALLPGQQAVYLTQTTLSYEDIAPIIAALRQKYPGLEGSGDICYATTDRQQAVRELAKQCELIIVIGSKKSSNSNRLCETARHCGVKAVLIDSPDGLTSEDLPQNGNVGLTAGASAPEELIRQTVRFLEKHNGVLRS
ncbi:MAG: 4-hydroxy-3-methylbut-2-enyl diphosphate reductase [Victivallaceae bacterium]|nr:4-hydroxy-3-methylbut-2-enyl diphosphate reductase [Victivallaceae bacterium]